MVPIYGRRTTVVILFINNECRGVFNTYSLVKYSPIYHNVSIDSQAKHAIERVHFSQIISIFIHLLIQLFLFAFSEGVRLVFDSLSDCGVVHGSLYSCLRAIFGLSVAGVLVAVFSCMLVYQLLR